MRIDKYDPVGGGFRAPLAADHTKTSAGNGIGVGLDSQGRVVPGAGNCGIKGVLVLTMDMKAGDIVDVMQDGEMVEADSLTAGTNIYADPTTGVLSTTATGVYVGHTVEATRLIVHMAARGAGGEVAALTSNVGGATPDGTVGAIPDPADTPASADALRDDLVANTIPAVRDALREVITKVNALAAE